MIVLNAVLLLSSERVTKRQTEQDKKPTIVKQAKRSGHHRYSTIELPVDWLTAVQGTSAGELV